MEREQDFWLLVDKQGRRKRVLDNLDTLRQLGRGYKQGCGKLEHKKKDRWLMVNKLGREHKKKDR
jgi:hypothetical protein